MGPPLALCACVDDGERCHVHQAADRGGRGEDVHRLGCPEQDAAYGNPSSGADPKQIEGNIRGIHVGHDKEIRFGLEIRFGEYVIQNGLRERGIAAHLAHPRRAQDLSADSSPSASRIFWAEAASELPKLECDNRATLGDTPNWRTSTAASKVISAICSTDGSRLMCVSQMKSCRSGRISICMAASVFTPTRKPITSRMYFKCFA